MAVPQKCTVLVVGGGPAGSYCASALAREGIDTVLLEAEKFPRYHIGESMLPSLRHFLRFVDCDQKFDAHGFKIKNGATFTLNHSLPPSYTDFVAAGGPNGYAWNVVRSEADEILFRHAGQMGARIFDGVKVTGLEFAPSGLPPSTDPECEIPDPGRPVSATWTNKEAGTSGVINFEYLVDGSGRAGLVSTKYLKNRKMNTGPQLKNIATWGYWDNGGIYAKGTPREGCPYFEALQDANGWVWFIPLHGNKWSVGVVMNQDVSTQRKRENGLDSKGLYLETIKNTPGIQALLTEATLTTDVKSASDWSYNAPAYASPYVRIAGDAGCFIDPFFSSGVHLALTASLSAAATICASIKGQISELAAATWHSKKVSESYTRFLVVVSSALKQINAKDDPVIADYDEKSFDRAFHHFRPIIQGTVDVNGKLSQSEVSQTLNFCLGAFAPVNVPEKNALLEKMRELAIHDPEDMTDEKYSKALNELQSVLTPEQLRILHTIRARQMLRPADMLNIDSIGSDVIDGLSPNLVTGQLGLVDPSKAFRPSSQTGAQRDILALLTGEELSASSIGPRADPGAMEAFHAMNGANGGSVTGFGVAKFTNDTNGVHDSSAKEHSAPTNGVNGTHSVNGDLNGDLNGNLSKDVTNGHVANGTNGSNGTNGIHEADGADTKEEPHVHVTPLKGHATQISDEATRLRMQDTLHRVAEEMETPHDTMLRLFNSNLEISVVKAALDLGIFKRLSESEYPLSTKMLAAPSGADPGLLGRMLRYLASRRMIVETNEDHFGPNHVTTSFSDPRVEGALNYTFNLSGPAYQAFPEYLKEVNYQGENNGSHVFHKAFNTNLPAFVWLQQHPEKLQWFQQLMSVPREGDWLDVLPKPSKKSADGEEGVVFVDVGGGFGHQCARLTDKYPELKGRVILQDRPEVVAVAPLIPGVKAEGHDFFTPQTVKGSQYYYLRTVLHDWNDQDAETILRNQVAAMEPGSKILIDEMVLPNEGVHWWSACLDLHMHIMLGSLERNERQWEALLDKAGLRLVEIKTYSPVMRHSIIVAEPK